MKRFKHLSGALALATIGFLGLSTGSMAAPIQTVTHGGVTCGQYNRGAGFPTTYWDCITPNTNTSNAVTGANAAVGLPASVKTVLTNANAQIYLFNNGTDYANFSNGTAIPGALGAKHSGSPNDGTATMAAIFSSATIGGSVTSLTNYYAADTLQQLGRIYGDNAPANANGDSLSPTAIFFESAINDDRLHLSNTSGVDDPNGYYPSSTTVWGATIAAQYPGKSPWEILGLRYGSIESFIYGFQVGRQGANATVPDLNTVLQSYMPTTRNWISQQFYGVNPQGYVIGDTVAGEVAPWPNAVLCVITQGNATYPLTWYSCVNPYAPSPSAKQVQQYPNTLPTAWKTLLQQANVQVLAMRDINSFIDFDGRSPSTLNGVLGFSVSPGQIRSASFQDVLPATIPPTTTIAAFTSGTILHELGHQFDRVIWNNISTANSSTVAGSVRWQNAVNADIAAFNALSCATAIDADRQANGLSLICASKPANQTNFDYLGSTALVGSTSNPELWARAFQKRAGGAQPAYAVAVQNRLGVQMQVYMNDLWTTGAPHN